MRFVFSILAVGLALVTCRSYASNSFGETVAVADVIGDAITFSDDGGLGQDRFEIILGKDTSGDTRIAHMRFDLSAFSDELANPFLLLKRAELILTEQSDRDAANGSITASISAYLHTQASGDWLVPDSGGTASLQPGVFGMDWTNRRTDRWNADGLARDCNLGATCDDPFGPNGFGQMSWSMPGGLSATPSTNIGPAFGTHDQPDVKYGSTNTLGISDQPAGDTIHTFVPSVTDEEITIDLLENITAEQMTDTLNEWVNGFNAGIALFSDASQQIFLESADDVNDGTGASFALDTYTGGEFNTTVTTESGNGAGGAQLRLTFEPSLSICSGDFLECLTPIRQNFGKTNAIATQGDLTGDRNVDAADFRLWKDTHDYLLNSTPQLSNAAVPEPNSLLLCALYITAIAGRRIR